MMIAYYRRSGLLAIIVAAIIFLGCVSAIVITREKKGMELGRIIGIHLGTTYSSVGVYKNGRIEIISNEMGKRTTPSWVAFSNNETLIGQAAKDQAAFNQERTVFHVKRLIGRKFDDEEVQRAIKLLPYKIANIDGKPYIKVIMEDGETKIFSPEEISAMILVKMKEIAEAFVGVKIEKAVLTVPAYFTDAQRQATRDAGVIAGLNVVEIIDEPTAAAIGYGMKKKGGVKNILVFDLGGATFDVTILAVDDGDYEVLAATGDQYLGGDNFDHRIMEYFINLIKKKHGKDISNENRALDKLRRESEHAKTALNRFMQHQVHLEIESLFGGTNFSQTLTRVQFEELNNDLFQKTMGLVKKAMDDAGLQKNQIDEIALVGGNSGIPKLQQLLKDYFERLEISKGVNPNVNPDEAVAYGAAIQGAILRDADELEEIYLFPVIPLSYGIETTGGVMTKLIPSGTPDFGSIRRSRVFTTYQDQQTTVSIKVFQGENGFTKNCRLLGKFNLSGIPPSPRGSRQIEVTLEIDVNYRLTVKAEDKGTGKAEYITINHQFTTEEILRMLEKGEETGDEILKLNDAFDARNALETYISNMKNQINDEDKLADKLESHEKEMIGSAIRRATTWLINNLFSAKEHHQNMLREIEGICEPIITAVYQKGPHVTHNT